MIAESPTQTLADRWIAAAQADPDADHELVAVVQRYRTPGGVNESGLLVALLKYAEQLGTRSEKPGAVPDATSGGTAP